mmetsp:Transcript_80111/g.111268  ORF Transcript_80111/g.111268 Transcript_80111/m.111268 type:complete len:219 (+) Transcript_80111:332-988(+)
MEAQQPWVHPLLQHAFQHGQFRYWDDQGIAYQVKLRWGSEDAVGSLHVVLDATTCEGLVPIPSEAMHPVQARRFAKQSIDDHGPHTRIDHQNRRLVLWCLDRRCSNHMEVAQSLALLVQHGAFRYALHQTAELRLHPTVDGDGDRVLAGRDDLDRGEQDHGVPEEGGGGGGAQGHHHRHLRQLSRSRWRHDHQSMSLLVDRRDSHGSASEAHGWSRHG